MSVQLRSRTLKSGAKSLYLDIHHNGERWREFLKIKILPKDNSKIEKKRVAERIRANRELELLSNGTGHIPQHLKKMNFFVFAENYILKYKNKDVRIIASSVEKFKKAVNNPRLTISAISPQTMTMFKDYLIYDAGLAGETAHNYFTRFKKVLKAAKVQGYLNQMPTSDIKFSNPNKDDTLKKQVLDKDELQKLVDTNCGNVAVKKAFLFACFTSLGLAEIRNLKWNNINKGRLITHRNKTGELINNRLSQTAIKILGKPKNKDDYIFDLQSLSDNGANKAIRYWVKRAKIDKHITFYCARHTFACQLLISGANLKTVADAMGHSSTRSTLKYLNHVQRLQDEAIDKLPELQIL
ncbi:site-specific integrase [Flagellimonas profundi]|uniref:Site-specific integrase n=1 Tax=Flagellimonas profundi TaxID=2915620 RepID=A0ABS3FI71_9FLAO|nr:site-specific integrase [Allomuricauda profundi]MBO0342415.1 site-specific integrase [Allomuricauda profundi]